MALTNWVLTDTDSNLPFGPYAFKYFNTGTGGGSFSRDSSTAPMTYLLDYEYVEKFLDDVLGRSWSDGFYIEREPPEEHPWFYNFYASSAEVEPLGAAEQADPPSWSKCKVTVGFRPLTYRIRPDPVDSELDRYVTRHYESSIEYLTINHTLKFVGSQQVLQAAPGVVVPHLKATYTWHQIPTNDEPDFSKPPGIAYITTLAGTVNETPFDGYDPGAVLFMGFTPRLILPSVATNGNYYWEYDYQFGIRNQGPSPYGDEGLGWNYFLDLTQTGEGGGGAWDLVTTDGTIDGRTVFGMSELNNLFDISTWE